MYMKGKVRLILLFVATFLMGLVSPVIIIAACDDEEIIIKTKGGEDVGNGGPRGYGSPVQASYENDTNRVLVSFLSDLGIVNIDIENEDTGELSTYMVNSAVVNHSFIISGDSGYWSITFTLLNGTEYVGLWTL